MNIAFIIALLIVGLVLLLLEIFVIPGVGVSGVLGISALVAGCVLAFRFGITTGLVVTGVVVFVTIVLIVIALRSKTWERLALKTRVESSAGQVATVVSVGDGGITSTRLAPMGKARIGERFVEVKSLEGFVDPGVDIKVVMIEDNIIYVKPSSFQYGSDNRNDNQ